MAKRKHAAALFEVIHSGQHEPKSLLKTPRWWFKKSPAQQQQQQSNAASSAAPAPTVAEREPLDENDPTAGRDAINHQIAPARSFGGSSNASSTTSHESAPATMSYASDPSPTRPAGVNLNLDPDRQQITFKVSYTSAIIVTFSIAVAVGLAYLVGQKMSRGPQVALGGQTTEQLRSGPKNPAVLDVGRSANPQQQQQVQREPETGITSRGPDTNPDNVEPVGGTNVTNPNDGAQQAQPQKRVVNLNYVIVQSYPDQKSADEARDALVKSGIAATVEKLPGWKDWYSVVGMQGFQRASGQEFDTYIRKIDAVSQQFTRSKRSFKAFQPMAYKWKTAA